MMDSTSPRLLSPLGTQRSNSPSTGSSSQAQHDFGGGYATSELSANLLSPLPSSMASKISHDLHDIPPSTSVRKKNFKTEYKSKFTPFDQYAYNEVTDSFVKQTTNLVESQPHSLISPSRSNQDLAYLQQDSNYSHLGAQQAIGVQDSTLCESSINGEDHHQARGEPWYKEVVRRNEKANEYRFKSEVGHSSPLVGYANNRSDSPYLNSDPRAQINSPFGNADLAGSTEQVMISLSDARSQHGEHSTELMHQDPKQKYRFTPNDYKRSDHMIAHMANNNNFALPKEQTDQKSARPRRAQLSNVGAKSGTRSTAQIRSRSQSTRRQPTSTAPNQANARTQPISSSQTTPTKTAAISRQPTTRTQLTSARPASRVTSVSKANATGGNVRPSSTAASKSSVGSTRATATSAARRTLASSNQTARLAATKPKPASNETFSVDRPASSSVATKKPAVPSARSNPVSRTTTSARPTMRTTTNAATSARLPPTNVKTSSSSRTTAVASAKNKVSSNKAPPNLTSSSTTNTVRSIETSRAIAAKKDHSEVAPKILNEQPKQTANGQPGKEQQSEQQQYKVEPNLVQLQQHRCFDADEPNWIFTTTQAGNMLADELAQAEKAAINAKKVEVLSSVQPRNLRNELDTPAPINDELSSPESTLDKKTTDRSEETEVQLEEKQEISEKLEIDLTELLDDAQAKDMQPQNPQNELDKPASRYDESSSPKSTLDRKTIDQSEETEVQFEEKQWTSEKPQIDLNELLDDTENMQHQNPQDKLDKPTSRCDESSSSDSTLDKKTTDQSEETEVPLEEKQEISKKLQFDLNEPFDDTQAKDMSLQNPQDELDTPASRYDESSSSDSTLDEDKTNQSRESEVQLEEKQEISEKLQIDFNELLDDTQAENMPPQNTQDKLDTLASRYDESSSPESTLDRKTTDQSEETEVQFEEKQEISEKLQFDLNEPFDDTQAKDMPLQNPQDELDTPASRYDESSSSDSTLDEDKTNQSRESEVQLEEKQEISEKLQIDFNELLDDTQAENMPPQNTQDKLDTLASRYDESSSPESTLDRKTTYQSEETEVQLEEKQEISEKPQIDLNELLDDTQAENDFDESNLNETLYVTALSGGDTTYDSTQLIDTGGALVDESQSSLSTARPFSLESEFAKLRASENGKAKDDDLIVEESNFLVDISPALKSTDTTLNGDLKEEETVIPEVQHNNFVSIPELSDATDLAKLDKDVQEKQLVEQQRQQQLLEGSQIYDATSHVKPLPVDPDDVF